MNNFLELLHSLNRRKNLASRVASNGTRLIGQTRLGERNYIHLVYPPLSTERLIDICVEVADETLPEVYCDFMRRANGMSLYFDSLLIYGWRSDSSVVGDDPPEPRSIIALNKSSRPIDAEQSCFFFGSYSADGSLLYMNLDDLCVYRCPKNTAKPSQKWYDFWDMLAEEIARLDQLYDDEGDRKAESQS